MKKKSELLVRRRELKEYIDLNMENTPMGLLLHFPSYVTKRFFGRPFKLPIMLNIAFLGVIVAIPTFGSVLIFSEAEILEPLEWLGVFVVLEGFCASALIAYFNVNRLLRRIRNLVIDSMISTSDLSDLQQWFSYGWTPRILKLYLLCWTIALIPIGILNVYFVLGRFQGVALVVWVVTFLFLSGVSWSYAPLNMILSVRLSRYQYSLHEIDPARSELVSHVSGCLSSYAYGYAVNAAIVQLIFAAVGQFYLFGITAALIAWIPLIIQFLLNQWSMRRIIMNAKWRTLNGIQLQIRKLHGSNITDKKMIESILRLMDYHDRIRNTPNSLLDFQSLLTLSNQLAIPSLGFVIANAEKIMGFLARFQSILFLP